MTKKLKVTDRAVKEKYHVPRSVRDVIPIRTIWTDGIFRTSDGSYAKTYRFTDINYQVASEDDKNKMYGAYCELINSLDSSATTKITINNHKRGRTDVSESTLMKMKGDASDVYRQEYNDMILEKSTGSSSVRQEKYITVSIERKSVEEARTFFNRVGSSLIARLSAMGAKCTPVDASEKLHILYDFYRAGSEDSFHLDLSEMRRLGHDFRDYICPDFIERGSDFIRMRDKYVRVFFLKDYASFIDDTFVRDLCDINCNMMFSIDIDPVPMEKAIKEVERLTLGVETNVANWQRRQNRNNNFSALIPYDMEQQRKQMREFLEDLTTNDQRMMQAVITMAVMADTEAQLQEYTEAIQAAAVERLCQLAVLKFQQMDGLNTALPIGVRRIDTFRTLTTSALAVFTPFNVQEIQDPGGIYYGVNAISRNLILCDNARLMNQSSLIFGVPGSGKSFITKMKILTLLLSTDDEILVLDPEGEYSTITRFFKDISTVVRIAAGGRDRINAMDMVEGYGEGNSVVSKSQFIMSLIEQIDHSCTGAHHHSIIDRCVKMVYEDAGGSTPTLKTLRDKLLEQPEKEAGEIALSLELFTEGSLDIFGKETNVDQDSRMLVYDIHDLGAQLKATGLLVVTDAMLNRVTRNWKRGRRTHVFIDEMHVVFENELSAEFFTSAWRQFRKRNAYPTAITQNVEYLLDTVQGSTMISNSEFIIMLNQAASDREKLAKMLNISADQLGFITDANPGCGLIRYGRALVPFVNDFPKETKLYQMMTTKPGEGEFARVEI